MKKYLIFLCVAVCSILCSCTNKAQYKEVDGRNVRVISTNMSIGTIEYVEFDEHEYVFFHSGYGKSLCHSPKCKCLNNN